MYDLGKWYLWPRFKNATMVYSSKNFNLVDFCLEHLDADGSEQYSLPDGEQRSLFERMVYEND